MTIPKSVRLGLKAALQQTAEDLRWESLGQAEKVKQYELWTRDPDVGGVLGRYMDKAKIRVYIKDTLIKDFGRLRIANPDKPLRAVGVDPRIGIEEKYIKPHGIRIPGGRIICWGRAEDWKVILMAAHERAFDSGVSPCAVVLIGAAGKYAEVVTRRLVEDVATKLCIKKLVWLP